MADDANWAWDVSGVCAHIFSGSCLTPAVRLPWIRQMRFSSGGGNGSHNRHGQLTSFCLGRMVMVKLIVPAFFHINRIGRLNALAQLTKFSLRPGNRQSGVDSRGRHTFNIYNSCEFVCVDFHNKLIIAWPWHWLRHIHTWMNGWMDVCWCVFSVRRNKSNKISCVNVTQLLPNCVQCWNGMPVATTIAELVCARERLCGVCLSMSRGSTILIIDSLENMEVRRRRQRWRRWARWLMAHNGTC